MKKALIAIIALMLTLSMVSCDAMVESLLANLNSSNITNRPENEKPDNDTTDNGKTENETPDNGGTDVETPDNGGTDVETPDNNDPDNGGTDNNDPDNGDPDNGNTDDEADKVELLFGDVDVYGSNELINITLTSLEDYTYSVYYKHHSANDSAYVKLSGDLMILDGNVLKCYIVGISAGKYDVRLEAVKEDMDEKVETTLTEIKVSAQDRSGYAHFGAAEGVGAYNNDGTLKADTKIIYVTNENKNTVTCEIEGQVYTGLVEILQAQYKSKTPMLIRVIGKITTNQWNYKNVEPRLADGSNATDDFFENTFSTEYGENLANLHVKLKGNGGGAKTYNYKTTPEGLTDVRLTNSGSKTTTYKGSDFPSLYGKSTFDDDSYYNMLEVKGSKNITIEGIGTDAEFFQFGISFEECSSIEIKNITFTDYPEDALNFLGGDRADLASYGRYWVHNCTFNRGYNAWDISGERDKFAGDGSIDFNNVSNLTLSYNYFNETKKSMLFGSGDSEACMNMTMHHNYFYKVDSRLPLGRNVNIHMYNNFFDQCKNCSDVRKNSYIFSESNYYNSTSKPFIISSSYVKSFGDVFVNSSATGITKVTDRAKTISGTCKPDKTNNLINFDVNSELFYYDSVNKCTGVAVMLSGADVPDFVTKHAGAGKLESLNIE